MLKVYIWLPEGKYIGHASLSFQGNYVSFWPKDSAGKKDLKIKSNSHPGAFMSALKEDIKNEGDRQPIVVTINEINEEKLAFHIAELMSNTPRYQLARNNCSHIVAECLAVACDKKPGFTPSASNYSKYLGSTLGRGIWTPHDILRYAQELSVNIV